MIATQRIQRLAVVCLGLSSLTLATGCQIDVNGQTLPSGHYLTDDVQYFPPGPEFKLLREATAMKEQAGGTAPAPQDGIPQ